MKETVKGAGMEESGPVFRKEKLLEMERFRGRTDLLQALLEQGGSYSLPEVDGLIDRFMKG